MEKVKQGFAKVVSFKSLLKNMPANLKISPIAMIPHKSRQFRAILDLSFELKLNGKKMPSVNNGTHPTAPQHSMNELGRVLERMIDLMASAKNEDQPFLFSKLDISDGFWRVKVRNDDRWNFCYVLPSEKSNSENTLENIEIVVPSSLQMGWTESPPFFCSCTETARDIAEDMMNDGSEGDPHPLEQLCCPPEHWDKIDNKNNICTTNRIEYQE
tara:strand:- start:32 stop:673 length:642 start_codon:yes stop_codon:yes gene_type:complete